VKDCEIEANRKRLGTSLVARPRRVSVPENLWRNKVFHDRRD